MNDGWLAGTEAATLAETNAGAVGSSTDNGQQDTKAEGENVEEAVALATSVEDDEQEAASTDAAFGHTVKRPNTLLAKSNGQQVVYPSWKLRYRGAAPLAESECFIVENSPAVELPPGAGVNSGPFQLGYSMTSTSTKPENNNNETGVMKMNNNVRSAKPFNANAGGVGVSAAAATATAPATKSGANPASMGTRFQSRLKNPSAYEQRQRFIYGRYAAPPAKNERGGTVPVMETKMQMGNTENISNIPTISKNSTVKSGDASSKPAATGVSSNATVGEPPKHELQDSGVKIDSSGGSAMSSGSDTTGSKATSPEGSLHRGLIDDEIRDQPELTFGRSDGSVGDQPSQVSEMFCCSLGKLGVCLPENEYRHSHINEV